ncbi:MAG: bifunctional oligoribonuclease/PAP phosphatase NrnA [Spirochaetia bacterium]|nr:bifunctional oligoribonuclease/PAP phosphatase NrnA [Spirochaetia bacterium]
MENVKSAIKPSKLKSNKSKDHLAGFKFNKKFLDSIIKLIKRHDKIILTTHIGSDPDGLGSEFGMYHLLRKLQKQVYIINAEKVPENYDFMIPPNLVKNTEQHLDEISSMKLEGYLLLVMDNSEMSRVGKILEICEGLKCSVATIDHHIVAKGKNKFVDASYSATSEIVWELYHYLGIPISHAVAVGLYGGIIADTGNFRYSKTTMRTHIAGGNLLGYGINSDEIYRNIYESSPPDRLILFKRILDKAIINTEKKYIAAIVKKSMFKKLKLGDTPTEGIVNQILAVKGILISALMTETPNGDLKCSLRSIDDVNVAALAGKFGGGGHRNAAGLFIKGPFKDAVKKVIAEIENAI